MIPQSFCSPVFLQDLLLLLCVIYWGGMDEFKLQMSLKMEYGSGVLQQSIQQQTSCQ